MSREGSEHRQGEGGVCPRPQDRNRPCRRPVGADRADPRKEPQSLFRVCIRLETFMITLEKLCAVETIITHDNCPDGTASAILLHDALPHAKIVFLQYGTDAYKALEPSPNTLFGDICPPIQTNKVVVEAEGVGSNPVEKYVIDEADRQRLQAFVDAGGLILDHHKTARPVVEAYGTNGVFGDEVSEPGLSGGLLAYRHVWRPVMEAAYEAAKAASRAGKGTVHLDTALYDVQFRYESMFALAEKFAVTAGIRDTWQNKHEKWREACIQAEVLRFYPSDNWLSKEAPFRYENRGWWQERMQLGELILTKHERAVQKVVEKAWRFTTPKGTRVVVFEGIRMSSDGAEFLGDEADLVIGFGYEVEAGKPKLILSTRTRGTYDCSAFARAHGGGGHTKAAGFNCQVDVPTTPNPFLVV